MAPEYIDDVGILEALESLNLARLPLEDGDYWRVTTRLIGMHLALGILPS